MNLEIAPNNIEFIYDVLDANAITFQLEDVSFSIQIDIYIDEDDDDIVNEPYFELNDEMNSQVGGLEKIVFHNDKICIYFQDDNLFLDKYSLIAISGVIDERTIDFFINHLFLGSKIQYSNDFDKENMASRTEFPDRI